MKRRKADNMSKVDSLVSIKRLWKDATISLYDKATSISEEFYSANLDLAGAAEYIGATPSELDSLLSLSELEEDMLRQVSDAKPPVTTWMFLANASEDELQAAIKEIGERKQGTETVESLGERLYAAMIQVAGPTPDQVLANLTPDVLFAMVKRAEAFKATSEKNIKALKSFGMWRKRGKTLTDKQVKYLRSILSQLVSAGAIKRNGIDNDQEMCDIVLDALEL